MRLQSFRWSSQKVMLVMMATIFAVAAAVLSGLSRTRYDAIPDLTIRRSCRSQEYPGQRRKCRRPGHLSADDGVLAVPRATSSRLLVFRRTPYVYVVFDDDRHLLATQPCLEYLNFVGKSGWPVGVLRRARARSDRGRTGFRI